jgi:hypothetical protein
VAAAVAASGAVQLRNWGTLWHLLLSHLPLLGRRCRLLPLHLLVKVLLLFLLLLFLLMLLLLPLVPVLLTQLLLVLVL